MRFCKGDYRLEILQGDITAQNTDAVVNAANKQLAPGGGVAGAIHRAAGPGLWEECSKLGGCQTGEAKITGGYNLPANYVVHTVGPVYGKNNESDKLLAQCYQNSLRVADENSVVTIAFPAISTGAFGYPIHEAARIALNALFEQLPHQKKVRHVFMVLRGSQDLNVHCEQAVQISKEFGWQEC